MLGQRVRIVSEWSNFNGWEGILVKETGRTSLVQLVKTTTHKTPEEHFSGVNTTVVFMRTELEAID